MVENYSHAAKRLRNDAKKLASDERFHNAGYLVGLAAECLAKEFLGKDGVKIDPESGFRCHFPGLKKKIREKAHGHNIRKFCPIMTEDFLRGWQIELRYEEDDNAVNVRNQWEKWQADVDSLFRAAGKI
jgi:hypothetical protein